ncbi:tape measure protein [Corynebacterium aquilae]|uniref:tape measure protein n=1 Tax=Corynebacterium aquilae TaxID=203263 RepID=UPI000A7F1183|nr:tape measure protein [Corynebacterium aquilae]
MATELGVGYISIVPETSKIAPGITAAMGQAEKGADKQGKSIGGVLAAGIGKTLKLGAATTGLSAGGIMGTAIYKGMGRLNAIEGARAKMGTLIESAADVDGAMQNALASVRGTAFGLGEAATTASSMVASGIKPGQQLEGVLKTVADTAAIAGTSMSDMGLIFGSVAARGKLQGDDMMQLLGRGIPVLQLLAKETGKTSAEISQMVSKGQVDFELFERAMHHGMEDGALAMGDTFQGAFANMNAALGRFGATLMGPIFTQSPAVFKALTGTIDVATEAVKPLAEVFGQLLAPMVEGLVNLLEQRVNPALQQWAQSFADWLPRAAQDVKGFVDAVRGSPEMGAAWEALSGAFSTIGGVLKDVAPQLATIGQTASQAIANISVQTWKILGEALQIAAPLIKDIVQFLADHPGVVTAFFSAWAGAQVVKTAVSPFEGVAKAIMGVSRVLIIAKLGQELSAIATATQATNPALASFARMGSRLAKSFTPFQTAAKFVLSPMKSIGKLAVQLVPRLLGLLGPWGLIAGAVAAVGGALYLFFTKTETGRKLWHTFTEFLKSTWDNVSQRFQSGFEAIRGVFDSLKQAWDDIKTAFSGGEGAGSALQGLIGEDAANRVMGIAEGVGNAWGAITGAVQSAVSSIGEIVGSFASVVGSVLGAAWDGVKVGAQAAWEFIQMGWQNFVTVVTAVWDQVRDTFTTVWELIKNSVFTAWQVALDVVATAISAFSSLVKGDWDGVGNALKAGWETIKGHVFDGFQKALDLLGGWWDRTTSRIGEVVDTLKSRLFAWIGETKAAFFDALGRHLADAQQKWERFKTLVGEKINALKETLVNIANNLKRAFFELLTSAITDLMGKFGSLKTEAVSKVNELGKFLQDFPNKVKQWFANAGQWLVQAGRDMIGGFKRGVEEAWSNVQSWASSRIHLNIGGHAGGGVAGYATGGRHPGYRLPTNGPGTHQTDGFMAVDARGVPLARLDAGEWVINQRSSQRYARELAQINAGTFPKLPGYKDGGLITKSSAEIKKALEHVGHPYIFGGWSEAGTDCSGAVSMGVNAFRGLPILDSRTATAAEGAWLENKGFTRGAGGSGDFTVAFKNGGPGGGHTAAQLPDGTFLESGGNTGQGLTIGGKAGPLQGRGFTDWYHAQGKDDETDGSDGFSTSSSSGGSYSSSSTPSVNWGLAGDLYTAIAKHIGADRSEVNPGSNAGVSYSSDPILTDENGDKALASWNGPDWGPGFFTHEVARAAKSLALPAAAAAIGIATTLVESGNPLKMYANKKVPESLSFRHDAVGNDYDSVGLFQQRQAGWGTLAQRMTPFDSAILFFERLKKFDWESMDPGAAAQKVQVSAFPDRYGKQMGLAKTMLKSAGVYDTGGVLPHLGAAFNLSGKPEIVINDEQLTAFSRLANNLGALVPVLERAAFAGDYRGGAGLIEEDDPLVDLAITANEFMKNIGGEVVSNSQVVQDAERGLAQTRRAVASEMKGIEKQEEELAQLRKELADASAEGSGLSTAATRKLEDAEKALARAREDAGKAKNAKGQAAAARRIADAEKRLQRAREDASSDLDKSSAKGAKKQKQILEKIAKAEDKLAQSREKSENAAKRLEAAERTVIAARGKAIQDILGVVGQAFSNVANNAAGRVCQVFCV